MGRNYYDRKTKVLFVVCSYCLHLYDYTDGDISTVHLAGTRHIGAFHARECMHDHSEFIRKCVNHVETLIVTGCFFLFLLARNTFMLLFSIGIPHSQ